MFVTRFAPSPTGLLHLGHAYSALLSYEMAVKKKGLFKLRIENIDFTRCKKVYEDRIYEDLYWLGIKWEEDVIIQSDRIQLYESYLKFLNDKGFIYGCRCSRSDIKNALSALSLPENTLNTFIYPGTCKEKKLNIWGNNVRIDIDKIKNYFGNIVLSFKEIGFGPNGETGLQSFNLNWFKKKFGDFVIARKDIRTSYHLAVTVDDFTQNVSVVSRGNDLFYFTPIHVLLQKIFNFKTPDFFHHRLITNNNGEKLSKTKNAESLNKLIKNGKSLEEIKFILDM